MSTDAQEARHQVAVANRILAEAGLAAGATASLGHASMRLPSDSGKFLVKGRGYAVDALARMLPQDMVLCDLEGNLVDGPPGVIQCLEVKLHSCIYQTHPEVQSVVHVHPRYTVVMSVLGAPIVPMCNEGLFLVSRPLPMYPHNKLIVTDEDGKAVAGLLGDSKAILLQGHGAITTGDSLEESVMNMVHLEEQAKMNWYAYCAAGPDHPRIPEPLIEESMDRPEISQLPHFKDVVASRNFGSSGAWRHYVELVSGAM